MRVCTKCNQAKPLFEFHKNSKRKDGLQRHCKTCKLQYQQLNPKRNEALKRYYVNHREECITRSVASQQKKREYYTQKAVNWVNNNRERHLDNRRAYYTQNRATEIERVRRRQRRIKNALVKLTPAYKAEIDGMYEFCRIFTTFEVDHIIPLNGKTVSGLHVVSNLQVLDRTTNRSKGNKYTPEAVAT